MPRTNTASPERTVDWSGMLTEALTMPGNIGNVYSRFYPYSFGNCLLLYMQGVREPVATYNRWKDLGRYVVKGARAKEIIRPITVKREDDEGNVEKFTRFKPVRCIFALSDTKGDDLPPAPDPPGWSFDQALTNLDITRVPFKELDGNTQGYSYLRNLAINPVAAHPDKTMLHEMGHIVLGHTTRDGLAEYQTHRGVKEFQAEGTAYLAGNELDILTDESASVSRAYIQGWLQGDTPPDASIRQVFKATDDILRAGRLAVEVAA